MGRRYKSPPIKPIPASHEPLVVDFTPEGRHIAKKITFYCASHIKRVNMKDENWMLGSFIKHNGEWRFSPSLGRTSLSESDQAALTAIVAAHFDEGWQQF